MTLSRHSRVNVYIRLADSALTGRSLALARLRPLHTKRSAVDGYTVRWALDGRPHKCLCLSLTDGVVDRNLESCVEELRADIVSGKSQVVLTDVEAMVLALGHIGRSLASLRGYNSTELILSDTLCCYTIDGFLHHSFSKMFYFTIFKTCAFLVKCFIKMFWTSYGYMHSKKCKIRSKMFLFYMHFADVLLLLILLLRQVAYIICRSE